MKSGDLPVFETEQGKRIAELEAQLKQRSWRPMSEAPTDGTLILAMVDHDSDPYFNEDDNTLTPYGAWYEGCGTPLKGPAVICWAEGHEDEPGVILPDWWFLTDCCCPNLERPVAPVKWMPIPE